MFLLSAKIAHTITERLKTTWFIAKGSELCAAYPTEYALCFKNYQPLKIKQNEQLL